MTTEERLRELSAAATAGPWERQTVGHSGLVEILDKIDHSLAVEPEPGIPPNTDATWVYGAGDLITSFIGNGPKQTDNGELITYLRNRAEQLADVVAAARAYMDWSVGCHDCADSGPLSTALAALDAVE
jgi:hypothetical protein